MFDAALIQKFQTLETPFYYYDLSILEKTLRQLQQVSEPRGYKVHYAMKANINDPILQMIKKFGFGVDCVSGNEVQKALETGFAADAVVFAGVGKTDREIRFALGNNIHSFNCESLQEIEVIDQLAGEMHKTAPIALRINPGVDAKTHHYITTGLEENKFGINFWELEDALTLLQRLENVRLIGLHFHIGSQITKMKVFKGLCLRVNEIQRWFREHYIEVEHLNLGGGLGVDYYRPDERVIPNFEKYFEVFQKFLEPFPNQVIHFELGRALVAQCSSLISRVIYVKNGLKTKFAILDAGMTELIRPALYQSYHKIENLSADGLPEKYDVVGPICESSDCFGKAVTLPPTKRGDLIAIRSTGAYGEVMASRYNMRSLPPAIYSDEL